jgi:ubiquinone/menaquinone biosynthesis C-methylase UbiE
MSEARTDTLNVPERSRWMQRAFAWAMGRSDTAMAKAYGKLKRELFHGLTGTVVELGPGAGANFRYFRPGVLIVGVEPNAYMQPYLAAKAEEHGLDFQLIQGFGEDIQMADGTADAVVSTLVLCSVYHPKRVVEEIHRVLKPGGRFVFIEHVAAPEGSFTRRCQRWVKPVWRYLGDGCCPDRETWRLFDEAGFSSVHLEDRHIKVGLPLMTRHIHGYAVK